MCSLKGFPLLETPREVDVHLIQETKHMQIETFDLRRGQGPYFVECVCLCFFVNILIN